LQSLGSSVALQEQQRTVEEERKVEEEQEAGTAALNSSLSG